MFFLQDSLSWTSCSSRIYLSTRANCQKYAASSIIIRRLQFWQWNLDYIGGYTITQLRINTQGRKIQKENGHLFSHQLVNKTSNKFILSTSCLISFRHRIYPVFDPEWRYKNGNPLPKRDGRYLFSCCRGCLRVSKAFNSDWRALI